MTWPDLVTTALLGTQRRPPATDGWPQPLRDAVARACPPGTDPAGVVLRAAALATVQRRAGTRAGPPVEPPGEPRGGVVADDRRPVVPEAARQRLAGLLEPNAPGTDLLPQWCELAHRAGYRPPPELVPRLLDEATRRRDLRLPVAALAGPLGRWLAARRPVWRWARDAARPAGAAAEGTDEPADPQVWRLGGFEERRAWLAALRRTDPRAAREALTSTWGREPGPQRAAFLQALAVGLGEGDEEFLERCLDDRRGDVREIAAGLLGALPGSALSARMADRARAMVSVERQVLHRRLVVRVPADLDPAAGRDGITDPPPSPPSRAVREGRRASWLRQVVAAAPLEVWQPLGTPRELLGLAAPDGWAAPLRAGWTAAAARRGDPAWLEALVADGDRPGADLVDGLAAAAHRMPGPERARVTVLVLDRLGSSRGEVPSSLGALLAALDAPWPEPVALAVLRLLHTAARGQVWPWLSTLHLAGLRMPPAVRPRVQALAATVAADDLSWHRRVVQLDHDLGERAALAAELPPPDPSSPPPPEQEPA